MSRLFSFFIVFIISYSVNFNVHSTETYQVDIYVSDGFIANTMLSNQPQMVTFDKAIKAYKIRKNLYDQFNNINETAYPLVARIPGNFHLTYPLLPDESFVDPQKKEVLEDNTSFFQEEDLSNFDKEKINFDNYGIRPNHKDPNFMKYFSRFKKIFDHSSHFRNMIKEINQYQRRFEGEKIITLGTIADEFTFPARWNALNKAIEIYPDFESYYDIPLDYFIIFEATNAFHQDRFNEVYRRAEIGTLGSMSREEQNDSNLSSAKHYALESERIEHVYGKRKHDQIVSELIKNAPEEFGNNLFMDESLEYEKNFNIVLDYLDRFGSIYQVAPSKYRFINGAMEIEDMTDYLERHFLYYVNGYFQNKNWVH